MEIDLSTLETVGRYLLSSGNIVLLFFDSTGLIEKANPGFAGLVGKEGSLDGHDIREFLEPESDKFLFSDRIETGTEIRLNFRDGTGAVHSLNGVLLPREGGWLFLAGRSMVTNIRVVETISHLNEQLISSTRELSKRNLALERARERIAKLEGLLPICATCKKIRNDEGDWQQIESYISSHAGTRFSHGICPQCMKAQYPDIYRELHGTDKTSNE